MPSPPIHWRQPFTDGPHHGHLEDAGGPNFAVIGECVGHLSGLYSVKISRKGGSDLWGYAGSVEQAKRHVERWARRHWRTVGWAVYFAQAVHAGMRVSRHRVSLIVDGANSRFCLWSQLHRS